MKSSMKENKRPAVGDSTTDRDLDDFVSKPGSSKKARFTKLLSEKQMLDLEIKKDPIVPNTEKKYSVGIEDLHWLVRWEE